jgi:hypothetical protein
MTTEAWALEAAQRAIQEQDIEYVATALSRSIKLENRCNALEISLRELFGEYTALRKPTPKSAAAIRTIVAALGESL